MGRVLAFWIALLSVVLSVPASAEVALTAIGVQDRLMIAFVEGVSIEQQRSVAKSYDLEVLRVYKPIRALVVESKPGKAIKAMIDLRSHPMVLAVEQDFYTKWIETTPEAEVARLNKMMQPNPAYFKGLRKPLTLPSPRTRSEGLQRTSEIPWGVARVNAPAAWPTNKGRGVKIAVVDTGIDPAHPDLKANIKGGHNAIDKNDQWADDHFHGTHVAGSIAASLNGSHVAGVAPEADLYAVKVLTKEGSGSLFGIIGGMMWCVENKMDIANMSLGAPQGNFMFEYAVNAMADGGVTVIAAAGNDGKAVNYPAAYESTIAISALCPPGVTNSKLCPSSEEGIATFSSRGPEVDFIAPGVLVPSTVPLSQDASGVKAYSGTSMATPHVAGLAALAAAKGAKGPKAIRAALNAAATKLGNLSASEQGAGLINAEKLK